MHHGQHPGHGTQRGGGVRAGGKYFWWTVGLFAAAAAYTFGGFATFFSAVSTKVDQVNAVFDDLQCCTCHVCDERAARDSADARTSQVVDSCSANLFGDEDALLDYCLNEYGRVVVDGMEYTFEAYSSLEDAAAPSFLAGCLEICPEEPKPVAKGYMSILPMAEASGSRPSRACVDVNVDYAKMDCEGLPEPKKQKTEEDTCATCGGRFGHRSGGAAIECKFCGLFYHAKCEHEIQGAPSEHTIYAKRGNYKCMDCKAKHGIKVFDDNLQQGGSTLYGARYKQEMGRKIDAGFQAIHGARAEKSMKRLAAAVASKATWDSHVARRCFCGYPSCRVYTIGPLSFSSQMEGGDCEKQCCVIVGTVALTSVAFALFNFYLRTGKGLHVVLKEKMAASKGTAVLDVLRANVGDDPGLQLFIVAIEEKVLEWNECREERRRDEF